MCFVNEGDWTAMVHESSEIVTTKETKCDECGQPIPIGAFARTIYMQEHEECSDCANEYCSCPIATIDNEEVKVCIDKGCQCEKPNFGETFDYDRCEGCDKFLQAIEAAELEEGCSKYEARPSLPMWDDLQGIGRDECKRYWRKAVSLFPEWKAHFGMLWRRCF